MRIGVIGTGAMGSNHLRVLGQLPQWRITCAADVNPDNLEKNCRGLEIIKLADYRQALEHVDAVMISTPTLEHYPICRFFLENGKHVLVEKPISKTLAEADQMIALAEQKQLVLAVGHLERFNPAVEYAGRLVEKPRFIEIQRLGSFSPRSLDIDVIMDLMIHDLDIILQWDRSGVKEIRASGVPIISKKIDIANVRLEFHSGLVANLTASRVSQEKTRKLRIFQNNLYLSVDYKKRSVKMFQLRDGQILENIPQIDDVEPLYNLWLNFYKTVAGAGNFNVSGHDGRAALQLALSILDRLQAVLDA
ncbi:MAG: Gfo/Idh/MocA family oxidoreductase [Candidatus Aminicenantes bacterium]|nr:Gfo/Idh/MocA family oxidoreductase [Candidatus Aminicenantes bacterium]